MTHIYLGPTAKQMAEYNRKMGESNYNPDNEFHVIIKLLRDILKVLKGGKNGNKNK